MPELTIVMPCLNEALTLPICIEKAQRFLRESGVDGEIIVADNGSTDGSQEIASRLGARVVEVPIKGYGAALSQGIRAANSPFVIMGDSDDSYNFLGLQPFVDKLREGYDLVMGNRFAGGISPGAMPLSHRFFGNPMLSAIGRRFYDHEVCSDFYCGLRGFRKEAIEGLRIQSTGMEFALEMMIKASLYRLKITEVPTTLSPDGRDRRPHLRTYRDGWRSLRLYLLMSPRWTFGIPGFVLVMLGILAFAISCLAPAPQPLVVGSAIFGVAFAVLGYQGILLAIFSKFIAIEVGLHPNVTRFWQLREAGTLERFLIVGGIAAVLSVALTAFVALKFSLDVSASHGLQAILFSVASLIAAGQTVIAGFALGILQFVSERREFPRKRASDH